MPNELPDLSGLTDAERLRAAHSAAMEALRAQQGEIQKKYIAKTQEVQRIDPNSVERKEGLETKYAEERGERTDRQEANIKKTQNASMERLHALVQRDGLKAVITFADKIGYSFAQVDKEYQTWLKDQRRQELNSLFTESLTLKTGTKNGIFLEKLMTEAEQALRGHELEEELFRSYVTDFKKGLALKNKALFGQTFEAKQGIQFPVSDLVILLSLLNEIAYLQASLYPEYSNQDGLEVLVRSNLLWQVKNILKENGSNLAAINLKKLVEDKGAPQGQRLAWISHVIRRSMRAD